MTTQDESPTGSQVADDRLPDPRSVIEDTDWAALEHAYGPARDTPLRLIQLLDDDPDVQASALGQLDMSVLHRSPCTARRHRPRCSSLQSWATPAPWPGTRATSRGTTERGDGGFIVTGGFTAADPRPSISGIGPAMAAVRNFVHSLHGEVAGAGVYAGVATPAALIKGSDAHAAMSPEDLAAVTGGATGLHVLDPDDLAETYWQLHTKRDRVEYRFPRTEG
ncbi:hypothetical protein ABZ642_40315 [Streptomyces sp. NPDC007157]|uniref:hypothetical protein n=1 Tax=Streptomyces sp. NPDC007157 TaxID=3154681 RepID=UPI0033F48F6F